MINFDEERCQPLLFILFLNISLFFMKDWLRLILLFIGVTLLLSCSRQVTTFNKGDNLVIYPPPPDTTRIQFLTSFSSSLDITGQRKGLSKFVLGKKEPSPIVKPYGLALHKGVMFVCDASINGLERIDLNTNHFEYFIPKGRGQLKSPSNCAIDTGGTLYVADAGRKQVVIFGKNGEYVDAIGETKDFKPTDVALTSDKIWIPDASNRKINVYDKSTKKLLFAFPDSTLEGDGHLFQPINICIGTDRVYVTDFGDFKIKSYTLTGTFISAMGSFGNTPGQFVRPKGISVDKDGILYAVDAGFDNVQMFNKQGQMLMFFGGPYKGKGDLWLPAKVQVDYDNLSLFEKFVDPAFKLKYIILVTNQYGPDKINVYGAVEMKKK